MKLKPKECINNGCKNIFYVPDNKLHMMLICKQCIEKPKDSDKMTVIINIQVILRVINESSNYSFDSLFKMSYNELHELQNNLIIKYNKAL